MGPFPPYVRWTREVVVWASLWRWWPVLRALFSREGRHRIVSIVRAYAPALWGAAASKAWLSVMMLVALAIAFTPWVVVVFVLRQVGFR